MNPPAPSMAADGVWNLRLRLSKGNATRGSELQTGLLSTSELEALGLG